MKKKINLRKLALQAEIVRRLDHHQLAAVAGGVNSGLTFYPCMTANCMTLGTLCDTHNCTLTFTSC